MLIYLARPNDHMGGSAQQAHVEHLVRSAHIAAVQHKVALYDPIAPFANAMLDPGACRDVNEYALERADALIALLPRGVPSVGVPMEIQTAWQQDKPMAVVGTGSSMQLAGMSIAQYGTTEEAVKQVLTAASMVRRPHLTAWQHWADTNHLQGQVAAEEPPLRSLKWTGEERNAPVPGKYEGDAGIDLVVSEGYVLLAGETRDIPCGVKIQMPEGLWGLIVGRSSTIRERGLHVPVSVIDNGWRGPIFVSATNISKLAVIMRPGERIAQFIPLPLIAPTLQLEHVEKLDPSDRGEQGFGSTGA